MTLAVACVAVAVLQLASLRRLWAEGPARRAETARRWASRFSPEETSPWVRARYRFAWALTWVAQGALAAGDLLCAWLLVREAARAAGVEVVLP